jgi:DNA-binding cell septation regulator SpoVG
MFNYSVKVFRIQNPKSKLVGFASLLIEDVIQVDGFKIFNGSNGIFVKVPSHEGKNKEGERAWYDDVKFIAEDGKPVDFKDKESTAALCRDEILKSMVDAFNSNNDDDDSTYNSNTSATTTRSDAARAQSEDTRSKNSRAPLW